jgi:hypothetical protein
VGTAVRIRGTRALPPARPHREVLSGSAGPQPSRHAPRSLRRRPQPAIRCTEVRRRCPLVIWRPRRRPTLEDVLLPQAYLLTHVCRLGDEIAPARVAARPAPPARRVLDPGLHRCGPPRCASRAGSSRRRSSRRGATPPGRPPLLHNPWVPPPALANP